MAFDWDSLELAQPPWRRSIVADIPPILFRRAKEGRPLTYTELAEELHAEFGHAAKGLKPLYGPPVGAVGQAICQIGDRWRQTIPPINVIVVNEATGLAGTGADEIAHYFFKDHGRGMGRDRETYLRQAMEAVFAYGSRWDKVAQALGSPILPVRTEAPDGGEVLPLPRLPVVQGPESPEHKALKNWVAANPGLLSAFGTFPRGDVERGLSSGDSLDAYFHAGHRRLAVEVKTSKASNAELERGVYQCVKYRAVLRAEQLAIRKPPDCDAVLASTRGPTAKLRALMDRLHVQFVLCPIEAERGEASR